MRRNIVLSIFSVLLLWVAVSAWAQDETDTDAFNLSRTESDSTRAGTDDEEEEARVYTHGIEAGKLEVLMTLGFLDLNTTLLQHDQIIYKYTDEASYWGDVSLVGESAFNPVIGIDYNLTSWFAIEPFFSLSVSQFQTEITNRSRRPNEEGAPVDPQEPELSEFDGENRSAISLGTGVNGLLYPFNFGSGEGRWHPFILGGFSRFWLDLNSNYTEGPSASWMATGGIGLRYVADDLVSIRLQVLYNHTELQFTPAEVFDTLDEGTREIPVIEFPVNPETGLIEEQRVESYASQTLNALSYAVGFIASF